MSKFESRPARGLNTLGGGQWAYVFYIDVEGHAQTPQLATALQALGERAGFLKILGSYPAAVL